MAFAVGTPCAALLLALMAILAFFYRDVPADGTPRNEDASAVGMGDVKGRDEIKWVKLTSEQTESVANATASDASTPLNVKTVVSSCLSLVGKVNYFWGWQEHRPRLVRQLGNNAYGRALGQRNYGRNTSFWA